MNRKRFHLSWLIAFVALVVTAPLLAQDRYVPSSSILSDQFGTESRIGQLAATRTIMIIYSAEREAGNYLKAWHQGLKTKLPTDTLLLAVADLKAVPFFVPKNAIIKQLATDYPDLPILLDWKGALGAALASGKSKATASLYTGGSLQMQLAGEYSVEKAKELLHPLISGF